MQNTFLYSAPPHPSSRGTQKKQVQAVKPTRTELNSIPAAQSTYEYCFSPLKSVLVHHGVTLTSHCCYTFIRLAPVVQTLDSTIHRINHYPADKYYGNQLRYLLDSDLSGR